MLLKLLRGAGEDLLYQDIKDLKRKKNVWNIFQNILQEIGDVWYSFKACPNMTTLNEISEVITGPFYPRHYPTNQSGSWKIRARKRKQILFTIEDMDFSSWGSGVWLLVWLERQQKDFLKFISNSHFKGFFFLIHFGTNRQICSYTTVAPSKTIPDSRPNWAKSIPVFRPKRRKNHTLWGGTYLA